MRPDASPYILLNKGSDQRKGADVTSQYALVSCTVQVQPPSLGGGLGIVMRLGIVMPVMCAVKTVIASCLELTVFLRMPRVHCRLD